MRYIVVMTPEGFINQEKETRHIFNATIQLLYCNIIFRPLILKMDFHTEILWVADIYYINYSMLGKISWLTYVGILKCKEHMAYINTNDDMLSLSLAYTILWNYLTQGGEG